MKHIFRWTLSSVIALALTKAPLSAHQMQCQMRPFCHLLGHLEWLFKMLNHFIHPYALSIAWISGTQVKPEVHLLVQHQMHVLVHLYVYNYWSSPLGATPELILSIFNRPDFSSICTLQSILKSILKCIPYTLSFAISVASFGGAICENITSTNPKVVV